MCAMYHWVGERVGERREYENGKTTEKQKQKKLDNQKHQIGFGKKPMVE